MTSTHKLTERAACVTLGVSHPSTLDEARKAYRALARKHHPDVGGDEERFKAINSAFLFLEELYGRQQERPQERPQEHREPPKQEHREPPKQEEREPPPGASRAQREAWAEWSKRAKEAREAQKERAEEARARARREEERRRREEELSREERRRDAERAQAEQALREELRRQEQARAQGAVGEGFGPPHATQEVSAPFVHVEPVPTLNERLNERLNDTLRAVSGEVQSSLEAVGDRLARLYRRAAPGRFEAGRDEELRLPIDLHALAHGKTLKVAIARLVPCPRCQVSHDKNISALSRAEGCLECSGEARVSQREELSVSVPPGADEGHKLRLAGRGRAGLNGHADGDLYLLLIPPNLPKGFTRRGADLTLELGVPAEVMRVGGVVSAQTPHGAINITVPPGSASGRQLKASGQGLARWGDPAARGDLLITLRAR